MQRLNELSYQGDPITLRSQFVLKHHLYYSFVLLVDVPVESGGAATMKDTAVRVQKATLEEPGSIRYGYYQDAEDPTSFLLFEWWREFNDMADRVKLSYFQELIKTFGAVGGDGRTIVLYKPLPLL